MRGTFRVLTVIAALVAVALAGCGPDEDPFVGTWEVQGADGEGFLVIAKTASGYSATTVIPGMTEADGVTPKALSVAFTREGDTLTSQDAAAMGLTLTYTYLSESGRLRSSASGALALPSATQEYERVSDSTEAPTVQ